MAHPLREAVKSTFYPFAERAGFERLKGGGSQFTYFRRASDDLVDLFDIQWDKYARPYFVINFGQCTPDAEQDCYKPCRLQRKRSGYLSSWFNLRKPLLAALRSGQLKYTPDEVVMQLITWFPEVEAWWATRAEGEHVYAPLLANKSFKPKPLRGSA
ncbi:DUF4304 domain-containing protein [Marilutibacter penaei]|uniref:DUF4304 domain-containing protein n=1 Tax=Marilutibacter penaei TaxID=2759900 RepID=UPI003CCE4B6E